MRGMVAALALAQTRPGQTGTASGQASDPRGKLKGKAEQLAAAGLLRNASVIGNYASVTMCPSGARPRAPAPNPPNSFDGHLGQWSNLDTWTGQDLPRFLALAIRDPSFGDLDGTPRHPLLEVIVHRANADAERLRQ
jgi:hypothetical protein